MDELIWIKILEEWRNKHLGSNGCTLPFLCGIQTLKIPPEIPKSYDSVHILNYLFTNKNKDEKYWLRECPNLKWAIIQKVRIENPYEPDDAQGKWYSKQLLLDEKIMKKYGNSQEKIVEALTQETTDLIQQKNYSLNNGVWGDYSPEERDFIINVISC